jgi:hypothetical protein
VRGCDLFGSHTWLILFRKKFDVELFSNLSYSSLSKIQPFSDLCLRPTKKRLLKNDRFNAKKRFGFFRKHFYGKPLILQIISFVKSNIKRRTERRSLDKFWMPYITSHPITFVNYSKLKHRGFHLWSIREIYHRNERNSFAMEKFSLDSLQLWIYIWLDTGWNSRKNSHWTQFGIENYQKCEKIRHSGKIHIGFSPTIQRLVVPKPR